MTDWNELTAPFPAEDLKWRVTVKPTEARQVALVVPYFTARDVQARLDQVLGPAGWRNEYVPAPAGTGVICRLSIRIGDEWIAKEDGAEATDIEPVKGALSDAFKRAAVLWGIGRYLYEVGGQWLKAEMKGKNTALKEHPDLSKVPGFTGTVATPPAEDEEIEVDTETGEIKPRGLRERIDVSVDEQKRWIELGEALGEAGFTMADLRSAYPDLDALKRMLRAGKPLDSIVERVRELVPA